MPPRLCIATGGRARDVTHSINKQSFVNKCNNSNSCKVFYLDYKTMLIHKLPQMPYTAFPLDIAGLSARKYSLFCIQHIYFLMSDGTCWETKSAIWNNFHSCHPSTFVQVSSSSCHRKRPAGQVCIGEDFSKLAKYERNRGKWKMLTRNVASYAAIPLPQRARATDEELTRPLVWWKNREPCLNRTPHRNTTG